MVAYLYGHLFRKEDAFFFARHENTSEKLKETLTPHRQEVNTTETALLVMVGRKEALASIGYVAQANQNWRDRWVIRDS